MVHVSHTAPLLRAVYVFVSVCVFGALLATPASAVPKASEFERAVSLPASTGAARAASARELTVDPGREFELAGFKWRGDGVPAISLRSYGVRGWSTWTALEQSDKDGPDPHSLISESSIQASDPVWTGRAWKLQLRVGGRGFRDFRVHFVHVVNTGGARIAATGGAAPRSVSTAPGRSASDRPAIVAREAWGANSCKPRITPAYGEVLGTVVHHTESTNTYSRAQAPSVVLGICRYHRNSKGWNDIGYNMLIDRFGTIYEGRAGGVERAVIGAHAQGYNSQTAGIAMLGGFMATDPPVAAMTSLKQALEWKLSLAGLTRNERVALISAGGSMNKYAWGKTVFTRPVAGHRDLDSTDCPGNVLYSRLPELAASLTGGSRPATRMNLRVKRIPRGNGQVVSMAGRLSSGVGAIAGKTVVIQAYTAKGWIPLTTATTDATGLWQATIAPKRRYYVRGFFAGTDELRPVRTLSSFSPKIKRPS